MRRGLSPEQACQEAIARLRSPSTIQKKMNNPSFIKIPVKHLQIEQHEETLLHTTPSSRGLSPEQVCQEAIARLRPPPH